MQPLEDPMGSGGRNHNFMKSESSPTSQPDTAIPWKQLIQSLIFISMAFVGVILFWLIYAKRADLYLLALFYGIAVFYAWSLFFQDSEDELDEDESETKEKVSSEIDNAC